MVTKKQAGYTPKGTDKEHCAICTHYRAPNDCQIVEGDVVPRGWCSYFKKKSGK